MGEGAVGWVEEVAEQDEEVAEVAVVGASPLQVALTKLWLKRGLWRKWWRWKEKWLRRLWLRLRR